MLDFESLDEGFEVGGVVLVVLFNSGEKNLFFLAVFGLKV